MIKFEKTRILIFFNLGIDFFFLITYNSYCWRVEQLGKQIEAWLSLVERCVRDAEVVGSNPVASIQGKCCWLHADSIFVFYRKLLRSLLGKNVFENSFPQSASLADPLPPKEEERKKLYS